MSSAPVRGIVPHRQKRHHHHHHHTKHQRRHQPECNQDTSDNQSTFENAVDKEDVEQKRPKVNPIFLWAAQCEQRIVEVRCEDYDKRNRIKLTKTAQGWRSIPRTALTTYPTTGSVTEDEKEQTDTLSIASKNDEKENSSRERLEIKHLGVNRLEDSEVNDLSGLKGVDDSEMVKGRHKRKRKKHSDFPKNKRRKTDSETEEVSSEALVSTSWKMKKRRKLKRKRFSVKEEIPPENKVDGETQIKIKKESKKEVENIDDVEKTEPKSAIEHSVYKPVALEENKRCHDLEELQKNHLLQPRVVLEQLHLSQLPTKINQRSINKAEVVTDDEKIEKSTVSEQSDVGKLVDNNVKNSIYLDNESRISAENQDEVVDKEDLQEILNMLDSNHFPISITETKNSLIQTTELSRNCTKIGAKIITNDLQNEQTVALPAKICAKLESDTKVCEKRNKSGLRDTKHRVGSRSLDETIERLEKSINSQKKIGSTPNVASAVGLEADKKEVDDAVLKSYSEISIRQESIAPKDTKSILYKDMVESEELEKDMRESSKILDALRNTPGISVSLAVNGRKKETIFPVKTVSPCNKSPDSQTEEVDKIGKPLANICMAIPSVQDRIITAPSLPKIRVESPESTVNFPKSEHCSSDAEVREEIEGENCNSLATEEIISKDLYKKLNSTCNTRNDKIELNHFDDKIKSTVSAKIPDLRPIAQVLFRSSEAQAKYSTPSAYQEIDNIQEQAFDEFQSQFSPQPSGIPFSISSSRRPCSAYLERLLPSPPCSVSCSEDARNDLTLKSILTSPNSVDETDQANDTNAYCDSKLSQFHKHSEERLTKESPISDKDILNQGLHCVSQDRSKYLETRSHKRPMSNGDVQNPFAADYVSPQRPLSAEWTVNQQRMQNGNGFLPNNIHFTNQKEFVNRLNVQQAYVSPPVFLDPASQLRELIKTSGHLIPDPLLVPRDYLPLLASAPLTEIPKLLATRPELRLPEALTRPELLRDPDLLVISLAHLQHVLDHGEGPVSQAHQQSALPLPSPTNERKSVEPAPQREIKEQRPKLSCKPIGKLMPAPMDLSNNHNINSHPPLLRVRTGLLKQESEVSSTANSPDDSQLWHPLFGSQKQRQQQQREQQREQQQQPPPPPPPQQQPPREQRTSWHRTTLASS